MVGTFSTSYSKAIGPMEEVLTTYWFQNVQFEISFSNMFIENIFLYETT